MWNFIGGQRSVPIQFPQRTEHNRKLPASAESPEDGFTYGPGALPEKSCLGKKAVPDYH